MFAKRSSSTLEMMHSRKRFCSSRSDSTVSGHGFQSFKESGSERASSSVGANASFCPNCHTTRLENFAVAPIFALFPAGFKIPVKLQDSGIVYFLAVGRKDTVHAAKDSFFPVDESSVTVEGENFKSAEVEHDEQLSSEATIQIRAASGAFSLGSHLQVPLFASAVEGSSTGGATLDARNFALFSSGRPSEAL